MIKYMRHVSIDEVQQKWYLLASELIWAPFWYNDSLSSYGDFYFIDKITYIMGISLLTRWYL